jgi:hypothetical protein
MRPRRSRRSLKVLALAGAIALTVAGIAAAAARHGRHHRPRAHAHVLARTAGTGGSFAVLGREPTAADAENAEVLATSHDDEGLRPAAARVLQTSPDGRTWLIPTDRGELCLGVQPAGQYVARERERGLEHLGLAYACSPTATVEAEGLVLRVYDEVVGLVPDDVSSVTTSVAGGAPQKRAVTGNTYRLTVPDGPQEGWVSFHDPNGVEQTGRL